MNKAFITPKNQNSKSGSKPHSHIDATGKVAVAFERMSFYNTAEYVPLQWSGSLASIELTNDIVRCFNFHDGGRALDCTKAFWRIRKAFGTNFDFAFGFPAGEDFRFGIAEEVGARIRNYVLNGRDPNVEVIAETHGKKVLLVDMGESSTRFGIPVFVRLDVHPLNGERCLFLDHILFTDCDGNSICGIADIPDRICNNDVRHADRAFRAILGKDYDVLGVNMGLFRAWDEASAKSSSEFSVDLSAFQKERESGTTICQFTRQDGIWNISLDLDGEEWTLGEIVGNSPELVADPLATECALDATRCALMRLSSDDAQIFIDYRHLFDEKHLIRFSDSFIKVIRKDPTTARTEFKKALRLELDDSTRKCDDWIPSLYHAGIEKVLIAGASIDSEAALLIPLYLTDEDRERRIPSTYLVACLKESSDGSTVCAFPTVLSGRQAEMNHRYYRRAVRNGLRAA